MQKTTNPHKEVVKSSEAREMSTEGRWKSKLRREKEDGPFFSKVKKKRFQFAGFKCGEAAETAELECAWADVSQAQE